MALAKFKDLSIDANEVMLVGEFWGRALEQEFVYDDDSGTGMLQPGLDDELERTIWINAVPEAKSVKSRVHLDVTVEGGRPETVGAVTLREPDDEISWTVAADPEGNEFCVFDIDPGDAEEEIEPTEPGLLDLVVDSYEPVKIATWWARVLDGEVGQNDEGSEAWVTDAVGFPYANWLFVYVPEAKSAKNRIHWDVELAGPDPKALVDAGATVVREPDDEISWWVLNDPEGNEFCAFEHFAPVEKATYRVGVVFGPSIDGTPPDLPAVEGSWPDDLA